jgi:hypothetical protein
MTTQGRLTRRRASVTGSDGIDTVKARSVSE